MDIKKYYLQMVNEIEGVKEFENLKIQKTDEMTNKMKKEEKEEVILEQDIAVSSAPDLSNYLPWYDYFVSLCFLTAARSKDPVTKVGCCIVNNRNHVITVGYNGMPSGIHDSKLPWGKNNEKSHMNKYLYVCHAEMNAIMNGRHADFKDCRLFVNKFPCSDCAKMIIQAGIEHVIYTEQKPEKPEEIIPISKMFQLAGVMCEKYVPTISHLNISLIGEDAKVTVTKVDVECNS